MKKTFLSIIFFSFENLFGASSFIEPMNKKRRYNDQEIFDKDLREQRDFHFSISSFSYMGKIPDPLNHLILKLNKENFDESSKKINVTWLKQSGYYHFYSDQKFLGSFSKELTLENYYKVCLRLKIHPKTLKKILLDDLNLSGDYHIRDVKKFYKERLAEQYKIHLMPKFSDVISIFEKLFYLLTEKNEFRKSIQHIKIHQSVFERETEDNFLNSLFSKKREALMPVIVIYPKIGKRFAQKVLNDLIENFRDQKGLDQDLKFNKKINSLILYSQGHSDDKIQDHLKKCYDQKDLVHYKSKFTGEEKDYHLISDGL